MASIMRVVVMAWAVVFAPIVKVVGIVIHHWSTAAAARSAAFLPLSLPTFRRQRRPTIGHRRLFFSADNDGTDYSTPTQTQTQPETLQPETSQLRRHVIVVGAGVGGLAVAARLASASASASAFDAKQPSVHVTVLEKNACTGGRCGSVWTTLNDNDNDRTDTDTNAKMNSFRHERGPSLLLLPRVYDDLFVDTVQTTAREHGLHWKACIPAYTVVFEDGDCIHVGFPKEEASTMSNGNSDNEAGTASPYNDTRRHMEQLQHESRRKMDAYEVDGAAKWDDYMALCRAYLQCGLPNFIEERFEATSFVDFVHHAVLKDGGRGWPLQPHGNLLQSLFASPKLQALASFPDLYVGLVPYSQTPPAAATSVSVNRDRDTSVWDSTAPAVFGLLSALELHPTYRDSGIFAPMGGFAAVQASLQGLCRTIGNIDIQTNCTVTRITNNGVWYQQQQQQQQQQDPTFLPADLVMVNADLPYATESLLGDHGPIPTSNKDSVNKDDDRYNSATRQRFDWNDKYRYSCGVMAFHWCVDRSWSMLLNSTHSVFLSTNSTGRMYQSWNTVRGRDCDTSSRGGDQDGATADFLVSPDEPFNFYVHRPTYTDPTAAPEGMDAITVLVPCPTLQRDAIAASLSRDVAMERYQLQFNDSALINRVREAVLYRLSAILPPNQQIVILHERVDTPATYADSYHVGAGSPFGLSHGLGQLSVFRPSPQSSTHPNVLFCGASTRPGNGVPLVLIGAKQVAERALIKLQRQAHQ